MTENERRLLRKEMHRDMDAMRDDMQRQIDELKHDIERHLKIVADTLSELNDLKELADFVTAHWDNQDMSHADFRVHAYQMTLAVSDAAQGGGNG